MDQALINHARAFVDGGGSSAKKLFKNGMNTNALRTNDVLRKEEWQLLDETLVGIARQRLIGINDLRSRGLVVNLGGLGTILSQYEKLGDMSAANVDYAAISDGEKDAVTFTLVSVPVPIIHKDFSVNIRRLAASQSLNSIGESIDTTQLAVAAAKVTESMEDLLFNGYTGGSLDGSFIYGYTTQASINTVTGSTWGTATNVTTNIISAIDTLEADSYFGPWTLYAATAQYGKLRNFFTDGSGDQVADRVARINGVEAVKPGDRLTAGTAVMVSMQKSVVDLAVGQDLTVVEWESKGGLMFHFKVMTALTPRVKSDAVGGSGICKLSSLT